MFKITASHQTFQYLIQNMLPMMPKIKTLKIPSNRLGDDYLGILVEYMKKVKIDKLNIGNNNFTAAALINFI